MPACLWSWARARRRTPPQLFDQLTPFGDLTTRLVAAIRVGDRRWTLKLASGLEIMLPDDNVGEALTSLAKLDRGPRACSSGISPPSISRLLDRVTVRLRETASANQPGGTPQADIPTASTKVAPVKGKT